MHTPLTHFSPVLQAFPHFPQLEVSEESVTQEPLQHDPLVHAGLHGLERGESEAGPSEAGPSEAGPSPLPASVCGFPPSGWTHVPETQTRPVLHVWSSKQGPPRVPFSLFSEQFKRRE